MSKVANHLHRYKKVNLSETGKYLVYRCLKPTCNHYISVKLAEGKLCECNRCGEPMIITKAVLTHSGNNPMARPHCPNCIKRRNEKTVTAIADFLTGTKA